MFLDEFEAAREGREGQPSDLELDALIAGALPEAEAHALEARINSDTILRARYEALKVDPPALNDAQVLAAMRREHEVLSKPSFWQRLLSPQWLGSLALAGAAAVAVVMIPSGKQGPLDPHDPNSGLRIKGKLQLEVKRKQGDQVETVKTGDTITPDMQLRFVVTLPQGGQVAVVGVEPTGDLYTAWPLPEHGAQPLMAAGSMQELKGAVSLDGPKGSESLYLVVCPDDVAPQCKTQGAGKTPQCPKGCQVAEGFTFTRP